MKMANIGLATPERDSHTRQVSAAPTIASNEGKYRDRNPDMSTVSSAAAATIQCQLQRECWDWTKTKVLLPQFLQTVHRHTVVCSLKVKGQPTGLNKLFNYNISQ